MKRRSSINSEEQVTCKTWRNVDTSGHGSQAFISAVEKFNENTFARADIWQQMSGAVLAADWLTMRRRNVQLGRPTKSNRTAKVAQHTQTHGHTLTKESMDQASSGSGPARRRDARSDDSRSFSLSLSLSIERPHTDEIVCPIVRYRRTRWWTMSRWKDASNSTWRLGEILE